MTGGLLWAGDDCALTEIGQTYREALALRDWLNSDSADMDDPHWQAEARRLMDMQDRIASLPPTCNADWAIKIMNADDFGTIEGNSGRWGDKLVADARKMIAA